MKARRFRREILLSFAPAPDPIQIRWSMIQLGKWKCLILAALLRNLNHKRSFHELNCQFCRVTVNGWLGVYMIEHPIAKESIMHEKSLSNFNWHLNIFCLIWLGILKCIRWPFGQRLCLSRNQKRFSFSCSIELGAQWWIVIFKMGSFSNWNLFN